MIYLHDHIMLRNVMFAIVVVHKYLLDQPIEYSINFDTTA